MAAYGRGGCRAADGRRGADRLLGRFRAKRRRGGRKTVLKISFFKGGYGDEWLKAITAAYTKEHPNVTFDLEGDADMTLKIGPRLKSGANLPDIAMILATNWPAMGGQRVSRRFVGRVRRRCERHRNGG